MSNKNETARRNGFLWSGGRLFRENALAFFAIIIILAMIVVAFGADVLTPYDPYTQDAEASSLGVGSPGHLLGTDQFGRDTATRLFYGARISLLVGVSVVVITIVCGTALGLVAGYFRRLDSAIMRGVDVMFAFPDILLALLVMAILGTSITNIVIAISIASVPSGVRLVRGSVLEVRNLEYVQAIEALGGGGLRIMFRHILPNVTGPIIVVATMRLGTAILSTAALSYLGLGAQPPSAEWGAMISDGQQYIYTVPHLVVVPGLAIALVVFAFNVLGDALRDYLDPELSRSQ